MNSLLIADTFPPRIGGRENYYYNLFTHLKDGQVVVVTPDKTGNWEQFDSNYQLPVFRTERWTNHWFKLGRPGRAKWLSTLTRICWQYQIDIVHCGVLLPDGLSGWLLQKTLGKPYIVYAYGKEVLEYQRDRQMAKLMQITLSGASKVVSISEYTEEIMKEAGVPSEKLVRILPGMDAKRWLTPIDSDRIEKLRQSYDLADRPVILTVARLIERKGHDKVIESMPGILSRFPDAVYLIVGDGPDRSRLQELRDNLGLQNSVIFAGAVSDEDLLVYYKLATVFAMISRQPPGSHEVEGFGIVYLEANVSGLPVVAGRSGGVPDAVIDGQTGYLVDPFSTEEIVSAIIKLLENPELRKQLANNGQERAINELSWEQASYQLQQLNAEVTSEIEGRSFVSAAINTMPLMLQRDILT